MSTAHWIAAARAREAARPDALFADPFAASFAGDKGPELLAASEAVTGGENPFLPIRTRFFDDLVSREADWLDQVVLLGAGFDVRAYRLPLPPRLHWFEIDTPEIFDEKERILARFGAPVGCSRHVVTADLAGDWSDPLGRAGFHPGRRTAWIAEGLLFYLPPSAVAGLVSATRDLSGSGSLFAADAFGSGLLTLPSLQPTLRARTARGMPPPFTTDDPPALLADGGWGRVEVEEPGSLARTYGRRLDPPVLDPDSPPTLRTYLVVGRS